jgi:hypothetical protein
MTRRVNPQVAARRRRQMANFSHKGRTQEAIARHMNNPQGTASRDLAAMREYWREFPIYDFGTVSSSCRKLT